MLGQLNKLPITTWRYVWEEEPVTHMGPMAQDFHVAFGLGQDEKVITTQEADGVAFAAIQALIKRTVKLGNDNKRLKEENAALRKRLERIEQTLALPELAVE